MPADAVTGLGLTFGGLPPFALVHDIKGCAEHLVEERALACEVLRRHGRGANVSLMNGFLARRLTRCPGLRTCRLRAELLGDREHSASIPKPYAAVMGSLTTATTLLGRGAIKRKDRASWQGFTASQVSVRLGDCRPCRRGTGRWHRHRHWYRHWHRDRDRPMAVHALLSCPVLPGPALLCPHRRHSLVESGVMQPPLLHVIRQLLAVGD